MIVVVVIIIIIIIIVAAVTGTHTYKCSVTQISLSLMGRPLCLQAHEGPKNKDCARDVNYGNIKCRWWARQSEDDILCTGNHKVNRKEKSKKKKIQITKHWTFKLLSEQKS
uniref:SRCR domain-containing protein n=1 Tax=Glossina brevipalpis TaxID=37001 RepID=A0A1A9X4G6_9MUSC